MGDYNLNVFRPFVQTQSKAYIPKNLEVYNYCDGRENHKILTVQDQLTTLKAPTVSVQQSDIVGGLYANNYDHFTYSPSLSTFSVVSYKVIDAIYKYCGGDNDYYWKNISDHLPILMEVEI